jgi:hypothetical protein
MRTSRKASDEDTLQITIPVATKKSLKIKAARSGDTMRIIVLRALASAGIRVPDTELQEKRKHD